MIMSDTLEFYGSATYSDSETSRNNSLYPDVNFATIGPAIISAINWMLSAAALQPSYPPGTTADDGRYRRFKRRPSGRSDTRSTYERNYFAMNGGICAPISANPGPWMSSVSYSEYQVDDPEPE